MRTKEQLSGALSTQKWRFLKPGLDDFRYGCPPIAADSKLTHNGWQSNRVSRLQGRRNNCQDYLSRRSPQQQERHKNLEQEENNLCQECRTQCLQLWEGLNDEVSEVLGLVRQAQKGVESEMGQPEVIEVRQIRLTSTTKQPGSTVTCSKSVRQKNPYTLPAVKEEHRAPSQHLDENIRTVSEQFCSWVTSLQGEEGKDIEATLLDLFTSIYENKPAVRRELHSSGENQQRDQKEDLLMDAVQKDEPRVTIVNSETLLPKDEELEQLHVTQAFRRYIQKKGLREPEFLRSLFLKEEPKGTTSKNSCIITASPCKGI